MIYHDGHTHFWFFLFCFLQYAFQHITSLQNLDPTVMMKTYHHNYSNVRIIKGSIESKEFGYEERPVPKDVSRFDYPWVVPSKVRTLTSHESRNRYMYSPLKSFYINGLGHNMATINGEVWTASVLNLTYTHRIARYMVHSVPLNKAKEKDVEIYRHFLHSGAVEQLFGWGVGEIPRERLQHTICSSSIWRKTDEQCAICNSTTMTEKKFEGVQKDIQAMSVKSGPTIQVDRVIELPYDMTYAIVSQPTTSQLQKMVSFMEKHPDPNIVFTLPSVSCDKNPYFGHFSKRQRAYFFHKYWKTHGHGSPVVQMSKYENETFTAYRTRVVNNPTIGLVGRRGVLTRLTADRLNIAVHARRGDFFKSNRPMLSTAMIGHLVRQIVENVIRPSTGVFSRMGISVMIYSEGTALAHQSNRSVENHDISNLGKHFVDVDGQILSRHMVREIILNNESHMFEAGLEVSLRVSENTILSIHEMIAADIFIGSDSSLSHRIVGSLSRAAFILLSSYTGEEYLRFIKFDGRTGKIRHSEVTVMKQLWQRFQFNHQST